MNLKLKTVAVIAAMGWAAAANAETVSGASTVDVSFEVKADVAKPTMLWSSASTFQPGTMGAGTTLGTLTVTNKDALGSTAQVCFEPVDGKASDDKHSVKFSNGSVFMLAKIADSEGDQPLTGAGAATLGCAAAGKTLLLKSTGANTVIAGSYTSQITARTLVP
ncbi:hypothetical protein RD136_004586 [Salmonella enterica]|nr:hypothetical protein [Salmonella enterica]